MKKTLFSVLVGILVVLAIFSVKVYTTSQQLQEEVDSLRAVKDVKKSVTITLTPDSQGKIYKVKTNNTGEYRVLLPVGRYTVIIDKIDGKCHKIKSYDVPIRQDIKCK